jgi:enoyl-CoA hydratase/carnithine racemase
MSDIVRYEQADGVAVVTLNRPDAMNSFTSQLSIDLLAALEDARNDDSVRAVVLTGEGRCFSAGADLRGGLEGRTVFGKLQYEYRPVMTAVASMPKPVIAAVPGSAAGIGLSLALTCDLLIMADDAFLLSPFTTISLVPDGGLNWLLVGRARMGAGAGEARAVVAGGYQESHAPRARPRLGKLLQRGSGAAAVARGVRRQRRGSEGVFRQART